MTVKKNIQNPMMAFDWIKDAFEYWLDSSQRWILFMDILRKRNFGDAELWGRTSHLQFLYKPLIDGVLEWFAFSLNRRFLFLDNSGASTSSGSSPAHSPPRSCAACGTFGDVPHICSFYINH
jgi:hypothetical protein